MPYSINRYNGTTLTVVEDGTIDSTLDIRLIGKNYAGYGEVQNENFLHLLENFSGTSAPPRPTSGQIWFDTATNKIRFYDGSKWRSNSGTEVAPTAPTGLSIGDLWFDSDNNQLYAWTGIEYVLIGPQGVSGLGTTEMKSVKVRDDVGSLHAIIKAFVNNEVVYIIASDEFTLDSGVNPIVGFSAIKKGLTLINTGSDGITSSSHRYWGTASDALKAETLLVDGAYRSGTTVATPLTVAVRNGAGDIYANVFQGIASSAKFADLAEKYIADNEYETGTVVKVGGDAEVTLGTLGSRAFGVVSGAPAYLMNKDLENGTPIALKGRVPVKVFGPVSKGDRLISCNHGAAISCEVDIPGFINTQDADISYDNLVFAIALESSSDNETKLIEAIIL
jgi:hypothetical protein